MSEIRLAHLSVIRSSKSLLSASECSLISGRIIGVIGPNGAGKTTLLRTLSGLEDYQGSLTLDGQELRTLSAEEVSKKVTYVSSELLTEFPLTVREYLELASEQKNPRVALERVFAGEFIDRPLSELSSGERQRVQLARAIHQDSEWIALDETFSKLDLDFQAKLGQVLISLAHEGKGILIVSHDLNFILETASDCLVLFQGRLRTYGSILETIRTELLNELYPEAKAQIYTHPLTGRPVVSFSRPQP